MLLLLVLVFLGRLRGRRAAAGRERNRRLAADQADPAALESALATGRQESHDQIVDIRKQELLSAIPWINRWLLKFELAPRLRTLLYQANLKWTAGGLLLMSTACFVDSLPTWSICEPEPLSLLC